MLPCEKCLSNATQCQAAVLSWSLETWRCVYSIGWRWAFEVAQVVHPRTQKIVGMDERVIVIHLPVVRTGPSLLVASACLLFSHRNTQSGEQGEEDFQVKVSSLRWSELSEVIASRRHATPSLLCNRCQ